MRANKDTLAIKKLFKEIQQYMDIHMLASIAKKELNTIVMKPGKSVNAYYHKIFALWEDASTSED